MTLVEAGFLLSLVQFAAMAVGILVGLAADGFGLRRSMLAGLAILAVSSTLGGFASEAWELMILRAIEGFGFLATVLPVPRLLRSMVPPERLQRKLGVWGAFILAGTALALLCGPWVMAVVGWRGWWWSLAAITAAMLAWTAAAIPRDVRDGNAATENREWAGMLRVTLTAPGPWLTAVTFGMYACQWMSVIGFLPTIYASGRDFRDGGRRHERGRGCRECRRQRRFRMAASSRRAARAHPRHRVRHDDRVCHCHVRRAGIDADGRAIRGSARADGCGWASSRARSSLLVVDLAPQPRTVSTAVGFMQQLSGAGQFVGPLLVAWVAYRVGGWQLTWTVTGGASLVGICLAVAIGRVHRRHQTARVTIKFFFFF